MSQDRPRIVLTCNQLGIGGSEKAMVSLARTLDRDRFDVRVIALIHQGSRRADLDAAGIETTCAYGEEKSVVRGLAGADLVHAFRHGGTERLLPAACRAAGVRKLIESSIFGAHDASSDERQFDFHLFASKMCALRYRRQVGLMGPEFFARHGVLRWGVEVSAMRAAAPARPEAKLRLGLDPSRPVVVSTGRADDRKWRNLLIDMLPPLRALRGDVQIVLVGITPDKMRRLARLQLLEHVRMLPTMGQDRLALVHAAADVYINAAEIGESLGMAMVEAMAVGTPVVTCSTPWVDNAQIELVDNGVNGYVASHPLSFAQAVATLLGDDALRKRFGRAATEKAQVQYDVTAQTRLTERIYDSLLNGNDVRDVLEPTPAEIDAFTQEYEDRLGNEFRPLTAQERRDVQRERKRERVRWAIRAARHADLETVKLASWQARARLGRLIRS